MLHMPRILILHNLLLTLAEDLQQQGGDVGFVAEGGDGGEERFEVEDDRAGEGEAAQGLPVDAQVDAGEGEGGGGELGEAVLFVWVAGRHEEGVIDFETPGAALDGAGGGEFGEVAVRERGVSLVVRIVGGGGQ